LYGRHAVLEALRAGRRRVRQVQLGLGVKQAGNVAEIITVAQRRGVPVVEVPRQVLDRAGVVNHQGVVAEAGPYPYVELDELLPTTGPGSSPSPAGAPLYLVLDHLQDVQNLGTLLRTAEAMAVTGVLLPDRRAASITPAVVNASAGAVEHLRIALVGNLTQALEHLKAAGVWVVGLDASPQAVPLGRADGSARLTASLTGPLALVVGAEGPGLARLVRERCDWLLAIPMYGQIASLNAAVAGSVALVAARQAREGRVRDPGVPGLFDGIPAAGEGQQRRA
jgi:23S rRNA (guanosine2251-2'-O)-methyltransferase